MKNIGSTPESDNLDDDFEDMDAATELNMADYSEESSNLFDGVGL
jgi:hypothetical protein